MEPSDQDLALIEPDSPWNVLFNRVFFTPTGIPFARKRSKCIGCDRVAAPAKGVGAGAPHFRHGKARERYTIVGYALLNPAELNYQ